GTYSASHDGPQPDCPTTQPKTHGVISVYDGHAVGVGRVITGATFHHYIDKNLVGDPQTVEQFALPGHGPSASDSGLPPSVLNPILDYYVNAVTWLAPRTFQVTIPVNTEDVPQEQSMSFRRPDPPMANPYLTTRLSVLREAGGVDPAHVERL